MNNENKPFMIYREGQLDYIATYGPIVKQKLGVVAHKIDYFFVNSRWPK